MQTPSAEWFFKNNSARSFFIALLLLCLTYRGDFLAQIYHAPIISMGAAFSTLALGLLDDLAAAMGLLMVVLLTQAVFFFGLRKRHAQLLKKLMLPGQVVLGALLVLAAGVAVAQQKIFLTLFTGLSYSLFSNSLIQGFTPDQYVNFMNVEDGVFILAPLIVFIVLQKIQSARWAGILTAFLLSVMLLGLLLGFYALRYNNNVVYFKILFQNPIHYVLDSLTPSDNYYTQRLDEPLPGQLHSVRLIDPSFVKLTQAASAPPVTHSQTEFNVVYIILESVGLPYVFDTLDHKAVPMPFLKKLSTQGLWLNNNYSVGNTSVLGVFGLLAGVYPSTLSENFEMQTNIHVPTLAGWLGKRYDSFFVMADVSNYFFQKNIVANTGFKKFYDASAIGGECKTNEIKAVDFFLQKITQAKSPFLAVYWSNATHYPYPDYGAGQRLFGYPADRLTRYYNNLHLVDSQIQRIYDFLAAHQLLTNTILVVVGDHGDGFGRHEDDWFHGRAIYQDQIQVPVLFYQPRLFKPQWVSKVTSSVDILPILFTALDVPWNKNFLQGEPLTGGGEERKYVFIYGNENELAAISADNIKMQISFENAGCKRYDLNQDAFESHVQTCAHDQQEAALIKFRHYQTPMLNEYNHWLATQNGYDSLFSFKDYFQL